MTSTVADSPAARWDRWNESGGPRYPHEKVVQFCFRSFPTERRVESKALDLGCGGGVNTAFLAREGFDTCATDVSAIGIRHTQERLSAECLDADLRVESASDVSYKDETFDLVVCVGVLESCGPQIATEAVTHVRRVLKARGRAVFVFAAESDFRVIGENPLELHGYSRAEVEAVFRGGFASVHIDRYLTTYERERWQQVDWLVTVEATT